MSILFDRRSGLKSGGNSFQHVTRRRIKALRRATDGRPAQELTNFPPSPYLSLCDSQTPRLPSISTGLRLFFFFFLSSRLKVLDHICHGAVLVWLHVLADGHEWCWRSDFRRATCISAQSSSSCCFFKVPLLERRHWCGYWPPNCQAALWQSRFPNLGAICQQAALGSGCLATITVLFWKGKRERGATSGLS